MIPIAVLAAGMATSPGATRLAQTATIAVAVTDPVDAAERVTRLVSAVGGRLVRGADRELVAEVPGARYRELVQRLAEIGDTSGEQLVTQDLTLSIAAATADERAAVDRRDRLERVKAVARSVDEQLLVEREMERAEDAIATAQRRRGELERQSSVTSVTIRLVAPEVAPITESKLPFPWLDSLSLGRLTDTVTRARPPSPALRSFIDGQVDISGQRSARGGRIGDPAGAIGVDLAMRDLAYADPVGFFGGFDLSLGGGTGFLYGLQGLGGIGAPIGRRVALGLATGPGVDGLTSKIPVGFHVPVELYVDLDATDFLAASLWARDGWVFGSSDRRHGSRHAPFGDEAQAGITLAFGSRDDYGGSGERDGLRLGFVYREAMDTRIYAFTLGFGAHHSEFAGGY